MVESNGAQNYVKNEIDFGVFTHIIHFLRHLRARDFGLNKPVSFNLVSINVTTYLKVKHRKSADIVRHSDEAHGRMIDVDQVLVERLHTVVLDDYFACFVEKREVVHVA